MRLQVREVLEQLADLADVDYPFIGFGQAVYAFTYLQAETPGKGDCVLLKRSTGDGTALSVCERFFAEDYKSWVATSVVCQPGSFCSVHCCAKRTSCSLGFPSVRSDSRLVR